MMHEKVEHGWPWHPAGCRCATCHPATPADTGPGVVEVAALWMLAGIVTAIVGIELYAMLTGAPGIEVIFQ